MAEVIKPPAPGRGVASERVTRDVAEMLLRIERKGEAAVRDYSRMLDDWDPPSFIVGADDIATAAAAVPAELREHIAVSQSQVRALAAEQLVTAGAELEPRFTEVPTGRWRTGWSRSV